MYIIEVVLLYTLTSLVKLRCRMSNHMLKKISQRE